MKVKNLISKLQTLNQEKDILINIDEYSYDIDDISDAYVDAGVSILEFNSPLTYEDVDNLTKQSLKFIATNESVYIIKPVN